MGIIDKIRFSDLASRESAEITRIKQRLGALAVIATKRALSSDEIDEQTRLTAIKNVVAPDQPPAGFITECCDPLWVAFRDKANQTGVLGAPVSNHIDGQLKGLSEGQIVLASLIVGGLLADSAAPPRVQSTKQLPANANDPNNGYGDPGADAAAAGNVGGGGGGGRRANQPGGAAPDFDIQAMITDPEWAAFGRSFYGSLGDATSAMELAKLVLPILAIEGDPDGRGGTYPRVNAREFAMVVRDLLWRNTDPNNQLRRRVNESLDRIQQVNSGVTPIADMSLNLPDLDIGPASTVVKEHVQVYEVVIPALMLQELGAFDVVDKMAEMAINGSLAIPPGNAGKLLYRYYKEAPNWMTPQDRAGLFAQTMGAPGGPTGTDTNTDFRELFQRVPVAVSAFMRRNDLDTLLKPSAPTLVSHQQVRKAARDLIENMSRYAYGITYYRAADVLDQINFMINLLNDPDVKASCNAQNMFDVIDYYSVMWVGRTKSASRYRTLANSSATIAAWLAKNVDRITDTSGPFLDIDEIRFPSPRPNGVSATKDPTDFDFVEACELWLLDTAVQPDAQAAALLPRESPAMPSRPVPIPAFAKDMLDSMDPGGFAMSMARH